MIEPSGGVVTGDDNWRPLGHEEPKEARVVSFGRRFLSGAIRWEEITGWWLAHPKGANTPNWDLISTCSFGTQKGLLLVEAKANEAELKTDRKPLAKDASCRSVANHRRIAEAIQQACVLLNRVVPGVAISRDSHYQLANRIAFSWKLASMGIPVILVYLGFLGDDSIADVSPPLTSPAHWKSLMREHTTGILPDGFTERPISVGKSTMWMLVRSRKAAR